MHKPVSPDLHFAAREQEISAFWKARRIFEKSIENRAGAPVFTFYDGPPTANGKPHIGHIITRAVKDIIPRYQTMKGKRVISKAGWDTHGLPVELETEKLLGLDGKKDIERYGVAAFNEKCKESVWKYTAEWREMSELVAYWCDMEHPYVTYHNEYIESVWWALKRISEQNLLYKGHKIVPYCPRCGTSLSSHEVAQGYADVTETSAYIKFRLKEGENRFFLAWTTTPWTLPSNVALAVNPKERYVEAKTANGEVLILAEALAETLLGAYETLAVRPGAELVGWKYEPLFDFVDEENAWFVVAGDFVTLTDGSGIVHIAPAFGEDDAAVGRANNLPFVQLVDGRGNFTAEAVPYAGRFCKDCDPDIIADLKARGLLFAAVPYTHSYPFCWRCDTPLLYYALDTWFIRMTAVKEKLLQNNAAIHWMPENIKDGRMGGFLENVVDWGLSRARYWGTPLPIWECACGHFHTVGSVAELRENGHNVPEQLELHKPFVDEITLTCDRCGGEMHRAPEVIDCWFDSGSMPFAQWHYPFENKEIFEQSYPAQFISEAIDQTRGWFYTLLAISTLLFDKPAFENCIVLGHVNDKNGIKMSKHKGNVVDPFTVLNKQGADAVRWYFYTGSALWMPSRFYEEAVSESQRKFMGTLWNTLSFYVLYANIDRFDATKHTLDTSSLSVMDRWILSRLYSLVALVDSGLAQYQITESARALAAFAEELSNWYVRRGRERYWGAEMTQDKRNAYLTLHTVLVTVAKLAAPFVPFLAESLYQTLVRDVDAAAPESVHLCDFPASSASLTDSALEKDMALVLHIVALGRAARAAANQKNRQPLASLYIRTENDAALSAELQTLVADELNVRRVVFTKETDAFVSYAFKPQLKTLGRRFGKLVPAIGAALREVGDAGMAMLRQAGTVTVTIEGQEIPLAAEDLLIETVRKEGFVSESDKGVTVVLDTNLTDDLIEEGFVREIVNKLQTTRKEAGFAVTDRIAVGFTAEDGLARILRARKAEILAGVLGVSLEEGKTDGFCREWSINSLPAVFYVQKI